MPATGRACVALYRPSPRGSRTTSIPSRSAAVFEDSRMTLSTSTFLPSELTSFSSQEDDFPALRDSTVSVARYPPTVRKSIEDDVAVLSDTSPELCSKSLEGFDADIFLASVVGCATVGGLFNVRVAETAAMNTKIAISVPSERRQLTRPVDCSRLLALRR